MVTKFTINSSKVKINLINLQTLEAEFIQIHPQKKDGMSNNCKTHPLKFNLPEGTTFIIKGHFSRSALTKLFGKSAMVRGVENY